MAIPFVVEDDSEYEEALLQQLYSDLFNTIQQIELIQRTRRVNQEIRRNATVPAAPVAGTSRQVEREVSPNPQNTPPAPIVNMALQLSAIQPANDLDAVLRPRNLVTPIRRRRRRRTRSEPSCCEENKPVKVSVSVEVTNKDWNQQVQQVQQSSSGKQTCNSESLLSKLVPAPFSGPLWTAVICMVGWHLLRTR